VYDPSLGPDPTQPVQIHDLNPGITADGLFWTIAIPAEGIHVQLGKGVASMHVTDVAIDDYGDIPNALLGGGPTPIPGVVSFTVEWSGVNERVKVRNNNPPASGGGFAGTFIRNTAQMEWTATVGDFTFVSDALATSASAFAEIGQERNGIFFPS
jgi:hypothetical protein